MICTWIVTMALVLDGSGQQAPARQVGARQLVEKLLKHSAEHDDEQESPFFKALAQLARANGLRPSELIEHKSEKSQYGAMSTVLADGRAVAVSAGGRRYAVAVLGYRTHTNPGLNAQKLILISEDGEVLDMIGCMMNAWHGQFVTEVLREPAADGAQLVVRLVPAFKTTWHPWHVITY